MHVIAPILAGTVACAACHGWALRRLRQIYDGPVPVWPSNQPFPKVAIVLSLRGNDPFLETCLRNLIHQDYPDFFLQVIVDSESDPAWESIRVVQSECDESRLRISILHDKKISCSLKNSSVIQAVKNLPPDREIVAFVDADAITHSTWLRSLVLPFADPKVGCTTGIRWFAPAELSMASRIRCYWNLFAAPVIHQSGIPWGGSMALRRTVLESGLIDEWANKFCEDAHTANHLRHRGLNLISVPEATVVNQETTSVSGCFKFFSRQMLIFRLYHRLWWPLVLMMSFATALRFVHLYFIAASLIQGDWQVCLALIAIYCIIPMVTRYEAGRLDATVRRMVDKLGQQITRNPLPDLVVFFCAEAMSIGSMLFAFMARSVDWRGIRYRINGPNKIVMLAYKPFASASTAVVAKSETVI